MSDTPYSGRTQLARDLLDLSMQRLDTSALIFFKSGQWANAVVEAAQIRNFSRLGLLIHNNELLQPDCIIEMEPPRGEGGSTMSQLVKALNLNEVLENACIGGIIPSRFYDRDCAQYSLLFAARSAQVLCSYVAPEKLASKTFDLQEILANEPAAVTRDASVSPTRLPTPMDGRVHGY